jgi:hypothetical protein
MKNTCLSLLLLSLVVSSSSVACGGAPFTDATKGELAPPIPDKFDASPAGDPPPDAGTTQEDSGSAEAGQPIDAGTDALAVDGGHDSGSSDASAPILVTCSGQVHAAGGMTASWTYTVNTTTMQACASLDAQSSCAPCDLSPGADRAQCQVTVTTTEYAFSLDPVTSIVYIASGASEWTPSCN